MSENKPSKIREHVIPNMEEWPIYRLSEDREAFVQEINDFTSQRIMARPADKVQDILARTIYLENIRVKEEPWKVDPPNERAFWRRMRKRLAENSMITNEEEAKEANQVLLEKIVGRYSEEIVGTFKIPTFQFARRFLTLFFHRLLNTAANRNFKRLYSTKHKVSERLKVRGEVEMVRKLMTKGTVIIVPTHFSNLDSILIGYVLDAIVGLPSFSYGAGLNLYNTGYTAYFMNRLGAYRVDRRKKNPIYLEALKAMSNLSIQRGTNSLFFPGGTRSRSGEKETRLKRGLLGTVVEAQRALCERGKNEKIFVVPLILGYHFVLEAQFLIEQHLKKEGKEQYLDASYSRRKILHFIWKLFSQSNDIYLSFGRPMDVLGNFVDFEGTSFDQFGKQVDIADYFTTDGRIRADLQREGEYTKILSDRIVDRFYKDNVVLSSHLLAFTIFNILRHQNKRLDLFGLLRLPADDYVFSKATVEQAVSDLREVLVTMEKNGEVRLSKQIHYDIPKLVAHGVKNLGNYHPQKPLMFLKNGDLMSEDFKLLYYYHNSLVNYNLEHKVNWAGFKVAFAAV